MKVLEEVVVDVDCIHTMLDKAATELKALAEERVTAIGDPSSQRTVSLEEIEEIPECDLRTAFGLAAETLDAVSCQLESAVRCARSRIALARAGLDSKGRPLAA